MRLAEHTLSAAHVQLLRPGASFGAAAACAVGALISPSAPLPRWLLGTVAVGAAVAACNVFNDITDVEADRINLTGRPLSSRLLTMRAAWMWLVALMLVALAAGWGLGPAHGVWVSLALALGLLYSPLLKAVAVLGNLVVAVLCANALLFGASLGGGIGAAAVIGGAEVATFTFGREALKGIPDITGDRFAGVSTIATTWGWRAAVMILVGSAAGVGALAAYGLVNMGATAHFAAMMLGAVLPVTLLARHLLADGTASTKVAIERTSYLWWTGLFAISLLGV